MKRLAEPVNPLSRPGADYYFDNPVEGIIGALNCAMDYGETTKQLRSVFRRILTQKGLDLKKLDSDEMAHFTFALARFLSGMLKEGKQNSTVSYKNMYQIGLAQYLADAIVSLTGP